MADEKKVGVFDIEITDEDFVDVMHEGLFQSYAHQIRLFSKLDQAQTEEVVREADKKIKEIFFSAMKKVTS